MVFLDSVLINSLTSCEVAYGGLLNMGCPVQSRKLPMVSVQLHEFSIPQRNLCTLICPGLRQLSV